MDDQTKNHLMAKVAKQYFEQGLTQHQIAKSLRISRSTISRLLSRAREDGIVQINIKAPPGTFTELERELEERFNLMEVIVVETLHPDSPEDVSTELGAVAANYLARIIRDNDSIAFAWGITMKAMIDHVQSQNMKGIKVFQMNGGLTPQMTAIHATSLTRNLAIRLGGDAYILQAPGVVEDPMIRDTLMAEAQVTQVFELAREADMAFFSIGTIGGETLWGKAGLLSEDVVNELDELGAVGDIMSRFFGENGQMVSSSLCRRVVGMPMDYLREIPRRVGVAGGNNKLEAIRGALHGGYINVLITDHITAGRLIKSN